MEIRVRFNDPLVSCSRHTVEVEIEQWIGDSGEIVGSGAAINGKWAHIDLDVCDRVIADRGLPRVIDELRQVLLTARVPPSTKMIVFEDDDVASELVVGE
jgi:hypothetical protein